MTRGTTPYPFAIAAVEATVDPEPDDDQVLPRQCGRCRTMFKGDPTLAVRARMDWCLCPTCEAILLPASTRRAQVLAFHHPSEANDDA
jgi:hypothetical protein